MHQAKERKRRRKRKQIKERKRDSNQKMLNQKRKGKRLPCVTSGPPLAEKVFNQEKVFNHGRKEVKN